MKKHLIIATAAVAMASCASDTFVGNESKVNPESTEAQSIAFGSKTANITRADHVGSDAAGMLGKNFVVTAVKGDGTAAGQKEAFDHYNVNYLDGTANTTESNTNDWEYVGQNLNIKGTSSKLSEAVGQTIKYWDYSTTQYDFVAVSLGNGTGTTPSYAELSKIDLTKLGKAVKADGTDAVYTLTGTADELASAYIADLVTTYNRDGVSDYNTTITPKFRRAGAKVRIAFYETIPGYAVGDVEFYTEAYDPADIKGTSSAEPALFSANAIFPTSTGNGVMSVYYPTTGWENSSNGSSNSDYNKAHVVYKAADAGMKTTKTFAALNYKPSTELNPSKHTGNDADDVFLGTTSATATYAGDVTAADHAFVSVLPQGARDNIQIRIKYTLYPTDGGKGIIKVDNATAVVPVQFANWQPNYAYTYIFKISDATNGSTGVDGDGNIKEGLTPITFDAIVIDSEEGQETYESSTDR